MMDSNQF